MNKGVNIPLAGGIPSITEQSGWNAAANTPTLVSGSGSQGQMYRVTVAGTTLLDGISSWAVGDWAYYGSDGLWHKQASAAGGGGGAVPYTELNQSVLSPMVGSWTNTSIIGLGAGEVAETVITTPAGGPFTVGVREPGSSVSRTFVMGGGQSCTVLSKASGSGAISTFKSASGITFVVIGKLA